ncbi:MAG: ArnT family glycosyltransferase [Candidatus Hodarchaeales archaeon]
MSSSEMKKPIDIDDGQVQDIHPLLLKMWSVVVSYRFVVLIGLLAFLVKVAYISSIDMWDEGWFATIAIRMADGLSDPWLPLYYTGQNAPYYSAPALRFFDKPPAAFWGGAILMSFFGRSTFAAKGIEIFGGAGLAVIVYYLFSHQTENRVASIIAALLVSMSHFLTFYSRTAYIDPFVTFMAALVMLIGIRAVDAIFVEKNSRKGYILLILVTVINALNILTKAWQGVLTAPAIALYLLFRYLENHVDLSDLKIVMNEAKSSFTTFRREKYDDLVYHVSFADKEVKVQHIVVLLLFITTFTSSYIISKLFISSIVIALVSVIGGYLSLAGLYKIMHNSEEQTSPRIKNVILISSLTAGLMSGVFSSILAKVFYGRLEEPFIAIAEALGSESVLGGIFGSLSFVENLLSNVSLSLFILELLSSTFGSILAFLITFFVLGLMTEILARKDHFFRAFIEGLDIIPLAVLGGWLGFWFAGILLGGLFFDRDAGTVTVVGVVVTLILTIFVSCYPTIKNSFVQKFKLSNRVRDENSRNLFKRNLVFLGVAIIGAIISFYPFVSWVQTLDANIANGTYPWEIRVPGELFSDPEKPDPVTFSFLFFEYYIGWRYTHATKYALPESFGSAINDYMFVVLFFGGFFLIGLYAFFFSDKKNPALGSALVAWFVTIPFVFFPAQFQLNYYYIPLAIPVLAISAKGIEYIYTSEKWRLAVEDDFDRFLAWVVCIAFGYSQIFLYIFSLDFTNLESVTFYLFYSIILLGPITYFVFRKDIFKTFPGIITAGLAYRFFIGAWVKNFGALYNFIFKDFIDSLLSLDFSWFSNTIELGAPLVTFIGLIILIIVLYWMKPKIKPQALIILGLMLSGMLINVSVLAHTNQILDLHYQEMAIYIKNHGGAYNHSTWVIPEAGANFAMRYYLGYEIVTTGNTPFAQNSSSVMESYYRSHGSIKFWVVINNSKHWDVPAYALEYPGSYSWLRTNPHLVCVDDILGITTWYKIHLFVNRTWIANEGYDWATLNG